jgi:hypothetical protein
VKICEVNFTLKWKVITINVDSLLNFSEMIKKLLTQHFTPWEIKKRLPALHQTTLYIKKNQHDDRPKF